MTHSPPIAAATPNNSTLVELEARLREAEETLDAIRNGDVDAVVVGGPAGQQVYTLANADRPYRVLIEQMQEGAITLSEGGTVLYCNQRFATLVGRVRESIIGEMMSCYFSEGERDAFRTMLARPNVGGGVSSEFTLRARGAVEVPVNISLVDLTSDEGMPRVVCAVVTDLTNNRRRSHELSAANKRLAREIEERGRAEDSLRLALDAAGMGSWDLDLATSVVRRSLRHDEIFGHQQRLATWDLQAAFQQFVPDDRGAVIEAFRQAALNGSIEFEARICRASDEAIRWLHMKGQTYYEGERPVRIAGVVMDVTERRAVEDQLRQAQKMEAVGQLTGGIAHDFNNLLMIIGGSLEILKRRVSGDDKTARLFEAAQQGVERGATLNQQLLAFSRRQDLRAEVFCVNDLIPMFENLLDRAVGETVIVKIEQTSNAWTCRTDPHQLQTAILNLAINARDAMPDGGILTLATENRAVSTQDAARWGAGGGDYVVVCVRDTGMGMPPEIVARVFEPFFTTKEVGKGTGLGLSQVYGFAKQSGGFVSIESEPGRGAAVLIHLPRTDQPKTEGQPDGASVVSTEEGRGVVLVVEDDDDVRATTCSMLLDLGYAVREAATARLALDLVERDRSIDLVFSDVIMPDGMSGIGLARELDVRRPGLPVLLTSGYTGQRVIPETLVNDLRVLRKPYSLPDLSQAIRGVMDEARKA